LCRCTGYRPIWDAARSLCDDAEELVRGPCGTPCRECPERDECEQDCNVEDKEKSEIENGDDICCSSSKDKMSLKETFVGGKTSWKDQPTAMFPKELLDQSSAENEALSKPLMVVDRSEFEGGGTWFQPNTLVDMLTLLKDFGGDKSGGFKIVVGNTEVGIGKILTAQCTS
jgi:xanthine dehydrogenase/oxidase